MPSETSEQLEKRRSELKERLVELGDMRPGSLVERYRRCGKPACHCASLHSRRKDAESLNDLALCCLRRRLRADTLRRRKECPQPLRRNERSARGDAEEKLCYAINA